MFVIRFHAGSFLLIYEAPCENFKILYPGAVGGRYFMVGG